MCSAMGRQRFLPLKYVVWEVLVSNSSGILYVVATPIGNLDDLSPRAVAVLADVDLVLAEDTRHSRPLLRHYGISTPLYAMHEHNESDKAEGLCRRLLAGESMALISDAGTPLVSDPGFPLVRLAHEMGITVSPLPGPSAALAALSVSGLPSDRFAFEGFLPAKAGQRRHALEALAAEARSLIFFESPRRLVACLEDMLAVFGSEREITLARELTKQFETVRKSTIAGLLEQVRGDANQQRGEIVLVVAGHRGDGEGIDASDAALLRELLAELPVKKAVALAVKCTGRPRNLLYELALQMKQEG